MTVKMISVLHVFLFVCMSTALVCVSVCRLHTPTSVRLLYLKSSAVSYLACFALDFVNFSCFFCS